MRWLSDVAPAPRRAFGGGLIRLQARPPQGVVVPRRFAGWVAGLAEAPELRRRSQTPLLAPPAMRYRSSEWAERPKRGAFRGTGTEKRACPAFFDLIKMRASQITGCMAGLDTRTKDARVAGKPERRTYAPDASRSTRVLGDRERATLRTGVLTRLPILEGLHGQRLRTT